MRVFSFWFGLGGFGVVLVDVQGLRVRRVPGLFMQGGDTLRHFFAAHHHLQVARLVHIAAGPVAGADPRDLAVDTHGLAMDDARERNEAGRRGGSVTTRISTFGSTARLFRYTSAGASRFQFETISLIFTPRAAALRKASSITA